MDEEQVKALITAALGEFETKLTTTIDTKNAGLAASLTREIKKLIPEPKPEPEKPAPAADPSEAEGKLTMKALQQQIQQLQDEAKRKDAEAFSARKTSALTTAIASHKALNQTALQKLLNLELGESIKEENGNWLVAQGESVKSLNDAIAAYLATDEGKAFLPPSGTAGAGSSESKTVTTPATSSDTKAGAALMEAF
jgi:glucan-binding YG repeat protein